jgi:hypothetical protein
MGERIDLLQGTLDMLTKARLALLIREGDTI